MSMQDSSSVKNLGWGETWPSRERFHELAGEGYRIIPIVRRILADSLTPVGLYERLAGHRSGTFILESAETNGTWSQYSFIGVNSMAQLRSNQGEADWLGKVPVGVPLTGDVIDVARATLDVLRSPKVEGLPNLTSGLVGNVGWDAIRHWEPTLPANAPDETEQPELTLALATDIAVVDHKTGSVWLIANAVNVDDKPTRADAAYNEAVARVGQMEIQAATPAQDEFRVNVVDTSIPQPQLRFRTAKEDFIAMVERSRRHIIDGDVFQVVGSQRLDIDSPADPFDVYRVLRTLNPSPYMYFMTLTDAKGRVFNVIGSSPETLIKVDNGLAMSFPIAGSRPRGKTPEEDERLHDELLADPKERSEHIMLVDLARNDSESCLRAGLGGGGFPDGCVALQPHHAHLFHRHRTCAAGTFRDGRVHIGIPGRYVVGRAEAQGHRTHRSDGTSGSRHIRGYCRLFRFLRQYGHGHCNPHCVHSRSQGECAGGSRSGARLHSGERMDGDAQQSECERRGDQNRGTTQTGVSARISKSPVFVVTTNTGDLRH